MSVLVAFSGLIYLAACSVLWQPTAGEEASTTTQEYFVNNTSCSAQNTYCSLAQALANCTEEPTTIIIESTQENLNESIVVNSSCHEDLWIQGSSISNTYILCTGSEEVGLLFMDLNSLNISNVLIRNCGMSHATYTYSKFALLIENVNQLYVTNIAVVDSPDVGLGITNIGETASIIASNFTHNGQTPSRGVSGGMYILQQTNRSVIHYLITQCTFADHNITLTTDEHFNWQDEAYGAGVYVNFSRNAFLVDMTFSENKVYNNSVLHGAGMALTFTGGASDINITIKDSLFRANHANSLILNGSVNSSWQKLGNGGGLLIAYLAKNTDEAHRMTSININITGVNFMDNVAGIGGGLHVMGSRYHRKQGSNTVTVSNSSWTNNVGGAGAAVYFSRNYYDTVSRGNLPHVKFSDCQFIGNENKVINQTTYTYPSGELTWINAGVFFSLYFDIDLSGEILFSENDGSAIGLVDAVFNFINCNATFLSNRGEYGGGIALLDLANLNFDSGTRILFENNTATSHGGAIYAHLHGSNTLGFLSAASCPFHQNATFNDPSNWNVTITFTNNSASRGKSIYITSIKPCRLAFSSQRQHLIDNKELFQHFNSTFIFTDYFTNNFTNQIATTATKYTPLHDGGCFIPGKEYKLPVQFIDDMDQCVNDLFFQVYSVSQNIMLKDSSQCISNNRLTMRGKLNSSGILQIQTVGLPVLRFEMKVKICQYCPPGYRYNDESTDILICECDVDDYLGLVNCSYENFTAYVKRGIWVGYTSTGPENEMQLVTSVCPLWYCNYSNSFRNYPLPVYNGSSDYTNELNKLICAANRTGMLCGRCANNTTVFCCAEANECKEDYLCSLGWLFFILSSIVPVTLMFLLITGFGINLTAGYLRGFLFFCQILLSMNIQMGGTVILPGPIAVLNQVWKVIYDIFRLRFFHNTAFSYCLFSGAKALDILVIQYLTTIHAFLMIMAVFLLFNRCAFSCRKLREKIKFSTAKQSVVNGMSALLILSYGHCAELSFRLLNFSTIYTSKKNELPTRYVYLDGEIEFLDRRHLPYAIPAIFSLCTVVALPLVVFLICPFFYKFLVFFHLEDTRVTKYFSFCYLGGRMKPFYDVFFSCFKDRFNFFAGLYFLYQILVLGPQIFGRSERSIILTCSMLVVMLMIHAIAQPYNNPWHNLIDTLLFTDLILITGLTIVNRVGFMFPDMLINTSTVAVIQTILLSMPLFVILLALISYCILKLITRVKRPQANSSVYRDSRLVFRNEDERKSLLDNRDGRERSLGSFIAWAQVNHQCVEST